MKINVILFLFILLININIYADTKSNDAILLQNELLKQQNEILKQANSDIRNSYYWALGFTGTFLVLFLGINTFLFRNKVKEDKEYLNNYVENTILKEMNSLKDNINVSIREVKEQNNKELLQIHESLDSTIKETNKPIYSDIARLRQNSLLLEVGILENKLLLNQSENSYYSKLSNNKQIIDILINNKITSYYWKIDNSLERIEEILKTGYKVDTSLLSEYTELLNKLPSQYSDVVHRIRTLML